jgi:hypothetical protein
MIAGLWSSVSSLVVYLGLNRFCFPHFLLKHLRLPLGNVISLLLEMHFKLMHSLVLHLPFLFLFSLLFLLLSLSLQLLLSQDRLPVHHRLSSFISKSILALLLSPISRDGIRISKVNQVLIQEILISQQQLLSILIVDQSLSSLLLFKPLLFP